MPLPKKTERNAVIAMRALNGETKSAIAADMGISAERVGQILASVTGSRKGARGTDVRAIMACVRARDTVSLAQVALKLGVTKEPVYRALVQLGAWPAVLRLFRWRRRIPAKAALLARIRQESLCLGGRTPSAPNLLADSQRFVLRRSDQTLATSYFGSWNNAVVAAGLVPRATGRPRRVA